MFVMSPKSVTKALKTVWPWSPKLEVIEIDEIENDMIRLGSKPGLTCS